MATRPRQRSSSDKADTSADAPVYLVVGDEFLVSNRARELVDRLCPPEEQALGLEKLGYHDLYTSIIPSVDMPYPYDAAKPRVKLFCTGGTIASRLDYRTGAVIPAFSPGELYGAVPEQIAREVRSRLPEGFRNVLDRFERRYGTATANPSMA